MTSHLRPPIACYQASLSSAAALHQQSFIPAATAVGHAQPGLLIPAAMEMKGGGWHNAVIGPVLQCLEAATLGMPLEVTPNGRPSQYDAVHKWAAIGYRCCRCQKELMDAAGLEDLHGQE